MKNNFFGLILLGWMSAVQALPTADPTCIDGLTPVYDFIKDNPPLMFWHEQIQQHQAALLQKLSSDAAAQEEKQHCQWIKEVKRLLEQANYQQIGFGQKVERCAVLQAISKVYEKRLNQLLAQEFLLPDNKAQEKNNYFTPVGNQFYFNQVQKNIEQNLIKINKLPVTKSTIQAESFSKECGEVKLILFAFDENNSSSNLNRLLNGELPPEVLKVKRNPLQVDKLLAVRFKENDFTYHLVENIDFLDEHVLSITQTTYTYSGGAHGNTVFHKVAFDLKKQIPLQLAEIFSEKDKEKILALAKAQFIKAHELDINKKWQEQGYWFEKKNIPADVKWALEDGFYLPQNFNISNEGITFIYQQYEITSYANGAPSFTISWQDLKPYLKPKSIGSIYPLRR